MNDQELDQIARQILAVLEKYKIPTKNIDLFLQVSDVYYEDVKQNFPNRGIYDLAFTISQDNWSVTVGKPLLKRIDDDKKPEMISGPSNGVTMNEETIEQLAKEIFGILGDHEIDTERFQLVIVVPKEYFETIKRNFSDDITDEINIGIRQDNWTIALKHLPVRKF